MKKKSLLLLAVVVAMTGAFQATAQAASDGCTAAKKLAVCDDALVKERVSWACDLVEKKGKEAVPEVNAMRYECCGEPNYVWLQDLHPTMIMHPIKAALNAKDLTNEKDPDGKRLFVDFVKAANKSAGGDWVEYKWPKFGETSASPKKSWVKKCKVGSTADFWVVGSGTWK